VGKIDHPLIFGSAVVMLARTIARTDVTDMVQIDKTLLIFPFALNAGYLSHFDPSHFDLLYLRVAPSTNIASQHQPPRVALVIFELSQVVAPERPCGEIQNAPVATVLAPCSHAWPAPTY
jgi:hypothetical protein